MQASSIFPNYVQLREQAWFPSRIVLACRLCPDSAGRAWVDYSTGCQSGVGSTSVVAAVCASSSARLLFGTGYLAQ